MKFIMLLNCRRFLSVLRTSIALYTGFLQGPRGFENLIVYYFLKTSQIDTKFGSIIEALNITLYSVINRYIIEMIYKHVSEV